MIDFGLAYTSPLTEDKAVDLYVLERAFGSTHPESKTMFERVLAGYKEKVGKEWPVIGRRLEEGKPAHGQVDSLNVEHPQCDRGDVSEACLGNQFTLPRPESCAGGAQRSPATPFRAPLFSPILFSFICSLLSLLSASYLPLYPVSFEASNHCLLRGHGLP